MSHAEVSFDGNEFIIKCEAWDKHRVKMAPERKWDNKIKKWRLPAVHSNAVYIEEEYHATEIDNKAANQIQKIKNKKVPKGRFPSWYKWKTKPKFHQKQALDQFYSINVAAAFMEMRTGKSFVAIALAGVRAMEGKINALVVVVDSAYKLVWDDEFKFHCPIDYDLFILEAGQYDALSQFANNTDDQKLKVLVTGVEAYSQGHAAKHVEKFISQHNCMHLIDESTSIKNHDKIRTKKITNMAGLCKYRMILTGTPITQGIHDLYSQFRYLDWKIIGMKSFFTFRNRYCIMGGFEGRKIVGYRNVPELMDLLRPYVFQCDAADVADPPERIYKQAYVTPTSQQQKMFDELGDPFMMMTSQGENELEVETVLERMTRYQQIAAGLFPYDKEDGTHGVEPIEGKNPKLEQMVNVIREAHNDTKIIIWARFQPEIKLIVQHLVEEFGADSVCQYHGQNVDTRKQEYHRFQTDPSARFFVTNRSGAKALELAAASMHIYITNSFSYEDRAQSEARTNSSKQVQKNVLYVDIIMQHKIDKMVHSALSMKTGMADYVKEQMRSK